MNRKPFEIWLNCVVELKNIMSALKMANFP